MKEVRIPKRNGSYRVVVVPDKKTKRLLQRELPKLNAVAMTLDAHGVQHGFTPARSPVTNAQAHVGYQWTLSFDLADCFDHVTLDRLRAAVRMIPNVPSSACYKGVCRQGLPTSPAMANIALAPLDSQIIALLAGRGTYTRYADDLTISSNEKTVIDELHQEVPKLCEAHGFPTKTSKTKIQSAQAGRRIITGVAVDHAIHPRRKDKRRLRAAIHKKNTNQAQGLASWCKLEEPKAIQLAARRLSSDNSHDHMVALLIAQRHQGL